MYNATPVEHIPPFLPIAATVLLKHWFDASTLDQGLNLLRQGRLSNFFIHRNSAACLHNTAPLTLFFKPTKRINAGFTIQGEHCPLCDPPQPGKRCAHIAALCILSLHEGRDVTYGPLPLLFKQSLWGKTADFFATCLSGEKGATHF